VRMGTTGAEKKLFFGLRRAKSNMNLLQEGDLSPEEALRLAQRQELERRRLQLKRAMQQLQERERSILAARRLSEEPLTLEDLSRQFGISRERVRQIEARAIEKLQRLMTGGRRVPSLVPA